MKTIVARLTRKGCTFESDRFLTLEAARHWGYGRWGNYTVFLHEDDEIGSEEPCKEWVRIYRNGVLI
jgi:hypothetical protein